MARALILDGGTGTCNDEEEGVPDIDAALVTPTVTSGCAEAAADVDAEADAVADSD